MSNPRWTLLLLLLPFMLTTACREESSEPGPPAARGSGVASQPEAFQPPEDGKLTAEQVEMYITVRRKAQDRAPAPATEPGEIDAARLAAVVTADLEAARELGFDREEYAWVKGRVIEARPPTAPGVPPELAQALRTASLEGLKRLRDGTEDPEAAARLDAQIASIEDARADGGEQPETETSDARVFNEELLSGYAEQLESLDSSAGG